MSDYLDKLSQFAAKTSFEDLSPEAVEAVKDVILDTIGAMLAGSRLPENRALAETLSARSGPATATIIGREFMAEPMMATLVNATEGVALEVDEGNRFGGGHPSIHTIPGAIAFAEDMGLSGQKLIEAALVGYEVCSRLGGATKPRLHVHSHGLWGTMGTATAVAKLSGFDADQIKHVINLSASMSPANTWTPAFEGATVRNLYPGRSGFQGILAVHLSRCGFTALADGPSDVYEKILADSFDQKQVVDGLGGEYRIQQNYFKMYACCRLNHPSVEAVMDARQQQDFSATEVDSIEIDVPSPILAGMFGEYPDNMLAAKFNVPYAVSALVVKGEARLDAFYPDTIQDDRVQELASRVRVNMGDRPVSPINEGPLAVATVKLRDGREIKGRTASSLRGDYGNRISKDEVVEKFHYLAGDILGRARANDVVNAVVRLDSMADIRELTSLVGGPTSGLSA